jgi:hypothetical protein
MTAIVYPAGLPRMQLWPTVPRERRAMSGGEGIKAAPRARSRDRIADIDAQWFYKPAHMAVWAPWYEDTLLNGTRWFAINAPGPGGWMQRVCRYRTGTVRREALPGGHWRVTAQLEQRGRSAMPVAPLTIGFTSGDDSSPVLPGATRAGAALLMYVLCRRGASFSQDNAAAWPLAYQHDDSSANVLRLRCFTRIADGTADDADTGFTSSDVAAWAMASISAPNDSYFPDNLVEDRDYKRRAVLDLGLVTKENSAPHVAFACAFSASTSSGGLGGGVPPGYTQIGDLIAFDFSQFAMTVTANMLFAYKLLVGQAEDGGEFDDGSGSFGSGGTGSVNTLVQY